MTAIARKFSAEGPYTFPVLAAGLTINGGMLVIPDPVNAGGVQIAGLDAKNCLGVCVADGAAAGVFSPTDAAAYPPYVAVESQGVFPVTFTFAAVLGNPLKCAANGAVALWIDATDDPDECIGMCFDTAVAANAVGNARINIL